ncbi:hypothetical protein O181_098981 [Austropuccinia psidii MF-1]|uniref:Uncharacterized protein n=1 Tax=Austropuccinia psidii MF-1 TaxID=1389203 RepID=A0A9Q3PGF9_9BASI|nr:hypothetical protein [Austropuccinia psidii MF-1]
MELPPSSYHDSLEELWDEEGEEEEEEIETMMKFVPCAYHQYSYVLFKVTAEKLPAHRTCDHHIEGEGSPPPSEVIDSLSNQDSYTLTASISDNVQKVFIHPTPLQQEHLSSLSKRRMVASICVLISANSML